MVNWLKLWVELKARQNTREVAERNEGLSRRNPQYQSDIEIFLQATSGKSANIRLPENNPNMNIDLYVAGRDLDIEDLWMLTQKSFQGYREMTNEDQLAQDKPAPPQIPLYRLRRLISQDPLPSSHFQIDGEPVLGRTLIDFSLPGRNFWTGEPEHQYGCTAESLSEDFHYQKFWFKDPVHISANRFDQAWAGGTTKKEDEPFYHKIQGKKDGWSAHTIVRNNEEENRVVPMFLSLIGNYFGGDKITSLSIHPRTFDEVMTLAEAKKYRGFRRIKTFEKIIVGHLPTSETTRQLLDNKDIENLPYGDQIHYGFYWKGGSQGLLQDRTRSAYVVKNLLTAVKNYREPVRLGDAMADVELLRMM